MYYSNVGGGRQGDWLARAEQAVVFIAGPVVWHAQPGRLVADRRRALMARI